MTKNTRSIPNPAGRREFLKRMGAFSSLGVAGPLTMNLAGIGAASAAGPSDYTALVCLFMFGGNDHHNMLIPYDITPYNTYAAARGGLQSAGGIALDRTALRSTILTPSTVQATGAQFALSPQMGALKTLFDQQKLAVLPNIGPLITPTNRTQYLTSSHPKPPKLFSHNDQVSVWQAYAAEGTRQGWGGRIGDLLASQNAGSTVFTAISASGNTVFLSGQDTLQYQVGTSGATRVSAGYTTSGTETTNLFGSIPGAAALRNMISDQSRTHLLERDHASIAKRSTDAASNVIAALNTIPTTTAGIALPTALASNRLARQLQVVARLIGAQAALGVKRQVFFVSIGGFDTHDNQIASQATLHASVADSMKYFYDATVALGKENNTTLFTASDFGRTLASNGDGSDHGWGSHHFVMGGGVKGGDFYGTMPEVRIHTTASPHMQDVGNGRFIPTTSVDQLSATLGRWMGVSNSDLATIAPNIANFNNDMGFMV